MNAIGVGRGEVGALATIAVGDGEAAGDRSAGRHRGGLQILRQQVAAGEGLGADRVSIGPGLADIVTGRRRNADRIIVAVGQHIPVGGDVRVGIDVDGLDVLVVHPGLRVRGVDAALLQIDADNAAIDRRGARRAVPGLDLDDRGVVGVVDAGRRYVGTTGCSCGYQTPFVGGECDNRAGNRQRHGETEREEENPCGSPNPVEQYPCRQHASAHPLCITERLRRRRAARYPHFSRKCSNCRPSCASATVFDAKIQSCRAGCA